MSTDAATVVARMQALSSAMSSLGPALEAAAPSGDFQAALDDANAALSGSSTATTGTDGTDGTGTDLSSSSLGAADLSGLGSATGSASDLTPTSTLLGLSGTDTAGSGATPVTGGSVVADAEQYLGVPYQWGGTDPATGLDCSGLVQRVYGDLGVQLPRTSQEQAQVGTPVAGLAQAQPGDLVFFEPSSTGPGHVGIYIGNGEMIDAPHTGTDVQIQRVGQPSEIRRVLPAADTGTAPGAAAPASGTASGGSIPAGLGVPSDLVPVFQSAAAAHGVPAALLAAVAKQESGFDTGAVSPAGAEGLMQLMPSTAAGLGVNPFDPTQAVNGAAQLLGSYLSRYGGSVPLALAAYNAGPGAVAQYGGVPPYAQTTAYVDDITAMLGGAG